MNKLMGVCVLAGFMLGGCAFEVDGAGSHGPDNMAQMSQQAIKTCGQGNVKTVARDAFTCKSDAAK